MPRSPTRDSKLYPELQRFETREEAGRVLKAWKKQLMKTPRFWLALIAYTVGVGVTVTLILVYLRPWLGLSSGAFGGVVGGVTGGTGAAALTWFWRRRCRQFLRTELVSRGVPICLKCGYDLRGQDRPRCPECGTSFDHKLIESRTT